MSLVLKIKHLLKHSAIYTIATFVAKLSGLLLLPVLSNTEYMPVKDLSGYGYFIIWAGLLTNILSLGMESTIVRYLKTNSENTVRIINSAITIILCSICVGAFFIFSFKETISEYGFNDPTLTHLVKFLILHSAFDLLANLPNYYFRADEKPKTFTFYKVLRFFIEYCGIIFFVVFLKWGVTGAIYGLISASFINILIMIPFYKRFFRPILDADLLKEMLKFGLPLLPNAVLYLLIEVSDRYFIEFARNKEVQTIYTFVYKFGGVLTVINMSFRSAWQPIMLREAQEKGNTQFFATVMTYFVVFSSILMIFISLLALDFIRLNPIEFFQAIIADPIYYQGQHILGFILMGYVCLGMYYNLSLGFYITKNSTSMLKYTFSGFLVNLLINCFMLVYPAYAMTIASFATFSSFFVMMFLAYRKSFEMYPVNYEFGKLVTMFSYMIFVAVIVTFFGNMSFLYKVLIAVGYIPYLFLTQTLSVTGLRQIRHIFGR